MAYSIELGTLVARAKQRANQVGGELVESPEWKEVITEYFGNLHSTSTEIGARYFETEATITATGAASYALPAAHLSTIGIDFVLDASGRRRELAQLMLSERTLFTGQTGDAYLWSLVGSNIVLHPTPQSGTYKHVYVPQPTDYSDAADGTSLDLINIHGYQHVLWGVASVALHRNESAQHRAIAEADRAMERFTTIALERALAMPRRRVITDVDLSQPQWSNPSWWWNRQ